MIPEVVNQVTVTIKVNEGQAHISSDIKTDDIDVAIESLKVIRDKRIAEAERITALENEVKERNEKGGAK